MKAAKIKNILPSLGLATLGGIFFGIGFIIPQLWFISFFGVVPLLYLLQHTQKSLKETFVLGWWAGCVLYGFALFAIFWHPIPAAWLGSNDYWLQFFFAGISWVLTILGITLAFGVWAVAVHMLSMRTWKDIFIIPSLWVLAEALGALLFFIPSNGSGSLFGRVDFTLGFVGYLLAEDTVLLQVAWVGGVFALSFLICMVGTMLYRAYVTRVPKERFVLLSVLAVGTWLWALGHIFFLLHPLPVYTEAPDSTFSDKKTADFAVLTTDLHGPYDPVSQLAQQLGLLEEAKGADIVVLPEAAEFFLKLTRAGLPIPSDADFYIDSVEFRENGKLYSRVEYYTPQEQKIEHSYKKFLLPIGEFIPRLYILAGKIFNFDQSETFQTLLHERQHTPGASFAKPMQTPSGAQVGVLFCNEAMSPLLYRSLAKSGANVLVNISSHLWFNRSHVVFAQIKHAAQVRAVENRRWYVQSNNTVPAYVLDQFGRTAAQTSWEVSTDVIRMSVPLLQTTTLYTVFGVWILLFPFGVVVYAAYVSFLNRKHHPKRH